MSPRRQPARLSNRDVTAYLKKSGHHPNLCCFSGRKYDLLSKCLFYVKVYDTRICLPVVMQRWTYAALVYFARAEVLRGSFP